LHDQNFLTLLKIIETADNKTCCIDMKGKNRSLKVCYVPATSTTLLAFFAVAIISTNEANKAGGM
jgi:hypothetical protein